MTITPVVNASIAEDPECWCLEFGHWIEDQCTFRDGCLSGLGSLHRCFSEWCAKASVPCSLGTFKQLLRLEGFDLAGELVHGLILKSDALLLQQAPRKGGRQ
jgi:hypothetical protein